jgi:general secretion pathway protein M
MSKTTDSLREQLEAQLAPLRARYEALQQREQLFVIAAGVVIALALVYSLVWQPFALARTRNLQALEDARDVAKTLAVAEAEVRASHPLNAPAIDRSMALDAAVEQASRNGTLPKALTSLQREGNNQVRVLIEGVPFDAATRWIYDLQTRYGMQVDVADLERQDAPGVINLRLSLSRAP